MLPVRGSGEEGIRPPAIRFDPPFAGPSRGRWSERGALAAVFTSLTAGPGPGGLPPRLLEGVYARERSVDELGAGRRHPPFLRLLRPGVARNRTGDCERCKGVA